MRTLYYHPICPLSRQARFYLLELGLDFTLIREEFWRRRPEFFELSEAGILPVYEDAEHELRITGIGPLSEYLAETNERFHYMPATTAGKAMMRQYLDWFNNKFYREVTRVLYDEKIIKLLMRAGMPKIEIINIAKRNFDKHFNFLTRILGRSSYIASDQISCADIAAACNISILDYMNEINWDRWPEIKHWFSLIKSRSGFRPLLKDTIPGFTPPKHYEELDF